MFSLLRHLRPFHLPVLSPHVLLSSMFNPALSSFALLQASCCGLSWRKSYSWVESYSPHVWSSVPLIVLSWEGWLLCYSRQLFFQILPKIPTPSGCSVLFPNKKLWPSRINQLNSLPQIPQTDLSSFLLLNLVEDQGKVVLVPQSCLPALWTCFTFS